MLGLSCFQRKLHNRCYATFQTLKGVVLENKSLSISFPKKKIKEYFTRDLNLSTRNTLTFLRGQSFFTSGFTIKNSKGPWLFMLDEHYTRLKHCYIKLFDETQLPFSYEEFIGWVNHAIRINQNDDDTLNILIVINAGQAHSYITNNENYVSGFGGNLAEVMVVVNKHLTKPKWSFKTGINVITQSYQRPIASAKPTNYIGGVQANFTIRAINALIVMKYLTETKERKSHESKWFIEAIKSYFELYNQCSFSEREVLRYILNDIRREFDGTKIKNNDQFFIEKNISQNIANFFKGIKLQFLTADEINSTEHLIYQNLIQECVFSHITNPNIILEGSTFSLMYIDQNDQLVFPSLDHNIKTGINDLDDSDGKILESTTILSLYEVAKKYNLSYRLEKLTFDNLVNAKSVLAISSTRMLIEAEDIQLQQINSINGLKLKSENLALSNSYKELLKSLRLFFNDYEYSVNLKTRV